MSMLITRRLVILTCLLLPFTASRYTGAQAMPGSIHDQIVFATSRDGNWEIYVMEADGANPHNLTNNPANDRYPAWSPDGQHIAFASNRSGHINLYVMDSDGANVYQVTRGPKEQQQVKPTWSPDGTRLAFDSYGQIAVIDLDCSNYHVLTKGGDCSQDFPAWSPDGKKIAYTETCGPGMGFAEIYVMDADGSNVHNVTNSPADDGLPSWSPDSRHIVFCSNRDGDVSEHQELYVMNVDGSNVRRLAKDQIAGHPSWSKDGTRIAFVSPVKSGIQIFVMNADGSNIRQITDSKLENWVPDWH
jgi:TolB protein